MSDDSSSNTAGNSKKKVPGKPFTKADPRINRLGRPKSFDEARKAAVAMFDQKVVVEMTSGPLAGKKVAMSRFEMLMMDWITSRNFQKQAKAIEVAYGKGADNVLMNIDLNTLTNAQLERLSKGEDIFSVLVSPNK